MTLTLASCTSNNPLFGLDTEGTGGTTSAGTTTAAPPTTGPASTTDPTTPGTTTTDNPTTEALTTDNPSAPVTSSSSDPGTSTGVNADTTTGVVENSTGVGESTGEPICALTKADGFSDFVYLDGMKAQICAGNVVSLIGKLEAGPDVLKFNTKGTGCVGESGKGLLTLGAGYALPVPMTSPCAKLFIYRDGDGPLCDIGTFFIISKELLMPLASGSFTRKADPNQPPFMLLDPAEEQNPYCCPPDAQDCCKPEFGDYDLVPPGVDPIHPGDPPAEVMNSLVLNIQNYRTSNCVDPNNSLNRRDWAALHLP
ncbi:MAG: hypothetical protein IPO88_30845 [Nannocystis sp.]|uniref:hypothetical protein n=1 Tax=Nannocystis sp. TaxID=1962667 RepID=UPI002429CFFC|nr:hypothetical protein [Nannocystis sp.]MBK9757831.1 hypothetical protein [Nannocystis sp.]